MRCCVCGGRRGVKYCSLCKHNFCSIHKDVWDITGVWERGVAAVKEWITKEGGTPFCEGHP